VPAKDFTLTGRGTTLRAGDFCAQAKVDNTSSDDIQRKRLFEFMHAVPLHSFIPTAECTCLTQGAGGALGKSVQGNTSDQNWQQVG